MPSVSRTLWSVISTPMPRSFRKRTMRWISITAIGSTPANGSSSSTKRGLVASARAISTRRRSPPDSDSAWFSRSFSICSSRQQRVEALVDRAPCVSGLPSLALQFEHGADVLLDRQLAEHRGFLRQVRQAERARAGGSAGSRCRRRSMSMSPASERHQADDHVERGGLAGAVRAEQADHFAAVDLQRHVAHHQALAVAFLQAADDQGAAAGCNGGCVCLHSSSFRALPVALPVPLRARCRRVCAAR